MVYIRNSAVLLVAILCATGGVFCQQRNAYQFIEPNISVAYDSTVFKQGAHYSNDAYGTEAYDFSYRNDTAVRRHIHIIADHADFIPSQKMQDSLVTRGIGAAKTMANDTLSIEQMDNKPVDAGSFSCTGVVVLNKKSHTYVTIIHGLRIFDHGYSQVTYIASNGSDLQKEYSILRTLLAGFSYYTQQQIQAEEDTIKKQYSIHVDTLNAPIDAFRYRPKTYTGIVSVHPKPTQRVSGVWLTARSGQEVFQPNENGEVPILAWDDEMGKQLKRGDFVLLNSFGKKVKIPFTFTYTNNGRR